MDHDAYADDYVAGILRSVRTIAMVGASANPARPSHLVMRFLQAHGYRVIPVNPGLAADDLMGELLGERVHARLEDIPERVDMVDVFRNSDAAGEVADSAVAIGAKVVWMQLGVRDDAAAARAEATGLKVVMNRCPKIEIARLGL